jgi:hypothetical protein
MGITFSQLCRAHAVIDLVTGGSILLNLQGAASIMHGEKEGKELLGSTPEDKLAIGTAERLVGVLLVDVGLILGVVGTARDEQFRRDFCRVALATHALMAGWRIGVASKVPALNRDGTWKKQLVGDVVMGSSWAWYLFRS